MSLVQKPEVTAKKLIANRSNGHKSKGAVTRAGKARAAAANLRHGFYSKEQGHTMLALGEKPKDYASLQMSLESNVAEGLEGELVKHIARSLWRIRRSERMQDGLAAQRLRIGVKMGELAVRLKLARTHDTYELLLGMARRLGRPDYIPSGAEIGVLENGCGDEPPADVREVISRLESLREAGRQAPASVRPVIDPQATEEQEVPSQHEELDNLLLKVLVRYDQRCQALLKECEKVRSPENIAALMAPKDETDVVMQKMEEAGIRQLWRLTNMLFKVRDGALSQKKIFDRSHDLAENKGQFRAMHDRSHDVDGNA